jgi:hypothetical protein
MNQVNSKPVMGTQTLAKKVLDFIIGFLGSIILVNIGIVLIAQILINIGIVLIAQILINIGIVLIAQIPGWILYFVWLWRLLIVGVAGVAFAKKRVWISSGIAAAILVQAFGM